MVWVSNPLNDHIRHHSVANSMRIVEADDVFWQTLSAFTLTLHIRLELVLCLRRSVPHLHLAHHHSQLQLHQQYQHQVQHQMMHLHCLHYPKENKDCGGWVIVRWLSFLLFDCCCSCCCCDTFRVIPKGVPSSFPSPFAHDPSYEHIAFAGSWSIGGMVSLRISDITCWK